MSRKTWIFGFIAILALAAFILIFKQDKIQRIWTIKNPPKNEQNSQPTNPNRLNEIVQMAESAKQKEKDLNVKIDELAKVVKCANTVEEASCRNTLKVLTLNKNVAEDLATLSKSMPIIITMRQWALYDAYLNTKRQQYKREDPYI